MFACRFVSSQVHAEESQVSRLLNVTLVVSARSKPKCISLISSQVRFLSPFRKYLWLGVMRKCVKSNIMSLDSAVARFRLKVQLRGAAWPWPKTAFYFFHKKNYSLLNWDSDETHPDLSFPNAYQNYHAARHVSIFFSQNQGSVWCDSDSPKLNDQHGFLWTSVWQVKIKC